MNELRTFFTRNLASDQKLTRLVMLEANLAMFEADSDSFPKRFITRDECCVQHFKPEIKRQSMQWKHSTSLAPKNAKVVSLVGKVMTSVFWDVKDICDIGYL